MYNPVSSDVTGWKIHHLYPFIDVFSAINLHVARGLSIGCDVWWQQRLFFGFDPEANGRNPKNHMVETNQPGWWFGTWLLFFYIYNYTYKYIYINWECHNPNWRTPWFFRGVSSNHQPATVSGRRGQVTKAFPFEADENARTFGLGTLEQWKEKLGWWKKNRWGTLW